MEQGGLGSAAGASDHRDVAGVGGAAGATWMMSMASSLWQRASSLCGATSWVQRFDSSSRAQAISSLTLALGGWRGTLRVV